jgi:hypothetical protein
MKLLNARYRAGQFWNAISAIPAEEDLRLAAGILSPPQMALFCQMQPGEQAHSLQVLKKIQAEAGREAQIPDLWAAALLHDVGKIRHPLRVWERVWIVLVQALFPRLTRRWGELSDLPGAAFQDALPGAWWRRPLIVAAQHPQWGADLSAGAGLPSRAVSLIRRHQDPPAAYPKTLEDRLLAALQAADGDL